MYRGGDNSTPFLIPPNDWFRLIDVLDHLIEDGAMDPILMVCTTFFEDDFNNGGNVVDVAYEPVKIFYSEFRKYLIPAVEKEYNAYYTGKEVEDIDNTRDHRAFRGFSIGSLSTWTKFIMIWLLLVVMFL